MAFLKRKRPFNVLSLIAKTQLPNCLLRSVISNKLDKQLATPSSVSQHSRQKDGGGCVKSGQYKSPVFDAPISAGESVSRAINIYLRYPLQFFSIGLLSTIPLTAWLLYAAATSNTDSFLYIIFLFLLIGGFCEAMIIQATFQAMRNRPVSVTVSIKKSLSSLGRVLLLSLVLAAIIGVGLLLLVIPGWVANAILLVAVPVCVIESAGVRDSLKRSVKLTKGSRYSIFGACMCLGIADKLSTMALSAIFKTDFGPQYGFAIALSVWYMLWLPLEGIFLSVVYHDLRVAKEGLTLDHIAAVFD